MAEPWDISQQLRHRRRVLPFRRATVRVEMGLLDVRWISSKINLDEGTSPLPLFPSLGNHFDRERSREAVPVENFENIGNGNFGDREIQPIRRRRNTVFHAINSNYNQSTSM